MTQKIEQCRKAIDRMLAAFIMAKCVSNAYGIKHSYANEIRFVKKIRKEIYKDNPDMDLITEMVENRTKSVIQENIKIDNGEFVINQPDFLK